MSQVQEPIVCPICMDDLIPNTKNFTNTECGHCFHASCLMTNIRHNGFGCPYCREEMVEEHNEYQDDHSEVSYITQDPVELYDDTALTTMRMLFQQVEGEEVEEPQEEEQEEETLLEEQEEEPIPPLDMIIRKLIGNRVTYEDLVKHVLLEHEEFEFNEDFETSSDKIFSTVRILVSNFGSTTQNQQPEPRFRNIFTTATMPDFASMTTEEHKKICQDYGIRYRMRTAVSSLTSIWRTHNE